MSLSQGQILQKLWVSVYFMGCVRYCGEMYSRLDFFCNNNVFDITKKKSKHYYSLLINKKAQFPSAFNKLQGEFHFSIDSLQKMFMFPHKVALKPCVKAFQYKILNSIHYTNTKLYEIGFSICNKCTFCQSDLGTLHHLLYSCPHSKTFWNEFEQYWFSITKERI